MRTLVFISFLVFWAMMPCSAQETSVRALLEVLSTSELRSNVLPTNVGWQPIYTQRVEVVKGDLLRIVGQTQLTVEGVPLVGQQLRLVVDGEQVGTQTIEVNTQPGSHHLPMLVSGLYLAAEDATVVVSLEGSSFHSDGAYEVVVDHADNLSYGDLTVDHFRLFPDLAAVWKAGALLLNEVYQPPALLKESWSLTPYVQEPLASIVVPALAGDIFRPSAQGVGAGTFGLEQFTGVITVDGAAASPYGGQNVAPENAFAPMLIEGLYRASESGARFLEYRLYGAFAHGLTLLPGTPRFDIAHYSVYGRGLEQFGQENVTTTEFLANSGPQEVYSRDVDLEEGDILQLFASLQFGKPEPADLSDTLCGLVLEVQGPAEPSVASSQKAITRDKAILPLSSSLTVKASRAGRYRISLRASGVSEAGPVSMRLDGLHSQLQYLHFSNP